MSTLNKVKKSNKVELQGEITTHEQASDNTLVAGNSFDNALARFKRAIVAKRLTNAALNELSGGGIDIAISYLLRFYKVDEVQAILEGASLLMESKDAAIKQRESKSGLTHKNLLDDKCAKNLAYLAIKQAYDSHKRELKAQSDLSKAVQAYKEKRALA